MGINVEVALFSELEFKHQVTTAEGEWGGGGGMRTLRCRGVQKKGRGRGGRGVVASRGWEGR